MLVKTLTSLTHHYYFGDFFWLLNRYLFTVEQTFVAATATGGTANIGN